MAGTGEAKRRFGPDGAWWGVLLLDALVSCGSAALLYVWSTHNQIDPAEPGPMLPQPSDTSLIGASVVLLASLVGTGWAALRRENRPETVRGARAVSVLRLVLLLLVLLASAI